MNHPYGSAFGAYTVGRLHLARGAVDLAIPILEQALERVERRSIVLNRPLTLSWLGYAYVLAGRVETGLPLLSAAVAQAAEIRRYEWGPLVGRLAEALLVAGRIDEALERGREALALAQAQEERGHEAWVLALLGRIHADQSPPAHAEAERLYRSALELAQRLGMRPLVRRCEEGLARLTA